MLAHTACRINASGSSLSSVARSGSTDAAHESAPYWLGENPEAKGGVKDGQDAQDTWTEMTGPALLPKVFPVYAFI